MSDHSIDKNHDPSLAILVEIITSPLLMAHPAPICLEVDIPGDIPVPADEDQTREIVRSITRQILSTLPEGGDLMLTACQTSAGIELEFADNGPDVSERSCSRPLAVAQAGASIRWQNCPQGGAAATVTFPQKSAVQSKFDRPTVAKVKPRKAA